MTRQHLPLEAPEAPRKLREKLKGAKVTLPIFLTILVLGIGITFFRSQSQTTVDSFGFTVLCILVLAFIAALIIALAMIANEIFNCFFQSNWREIWGGTRWVTLRASLIYAIIFGICCLLQ